MLILTVPLTLIGSISYYYINSIAGGKIENSIQDNLLQVKTKLENMLNSIDYISIQLACNTNISNALERYMQTDNVNDKYDIYSDINKYISMISLSNPNTGTIYYTLKEPWEPILGNINYKGEFNPDKLPVLVAPRGASFYGPHKACYKNTGSLVFSVARKLAMSQVDCYAYVETETEFFGNVFVNSDWYGFKISYLLLNDKGNIIYSEFPEDFPTETYFKPTGSGIKKLDYKGYYVFSEKSSKGWQVAAVIEKQAYNKMSNDWVMDFILLSIISFAICGICGLFVWKMVYSPLKSLRKGIELTERNNFNSKIKLTNIFEFDHLLSEFMQMQGRVKQLLVEVEQKERKRRQFEVEKLMYQINPHFLHNTLNAVQWLARISGQNKIDRIIALLTKVLHYNLGKEGGIVTLKDEVQALHDYVDLQMIRYSNQVNIEIIEDPMAMDVKVPRFILQPLVENAIYHGLGQEGGHICVKIEKSGEDNVIVTVRDEGSGMSREKLENLLSEKADRSEGMGIGINYVNRIIKYYFADEAELRIESCEDKGTSVILKIPCRMDIRE